MLIWLVPGSCEMERMPVIEDCAGWASEMEAIVDVLCPFNTVYVAAVPPPNPTMRMTAASAGEKRICRSQAAGSNTRRCQNLPCSVVSRASCSRMREEARKLGLGSSTGNCEIVEWKLRADFNSPAQSVHRPKCCSSS